VAIGWPTVAQVCIDALNNRITAAVLSQVLRFGGHYKVNAGMGRIDCYAMVRLTG
jgi:hypothetical protein